MTPPSIAAVVLAAGTSSRMGGVNKQLATIGETPMAARAADAALAPEPTRLWPSTSPETDCPLTVRDTVGID